MYLWAMRQFKYLLFFLIINFGGLAIGSLLMDGGPTAFWYTNLNQAPWTPPGWVFGFAWTTIMICFSFYMALLLNRQKTKLIAVLFIIHFILNVSWNFVFFNQHQVALGLMVILALTGLTFFFLLNYKDVLKRKSLLILPYVIWMCIASSLNLYILIYN